MSTTSAASAAGATTNATSAAAMARLKAGMFLIFMVLLEALPDAKRRVSALRALREVEPDRLQPELRDVEPEPDTDVSVEGELVEVGGRTVAVDLRPAANPDRPIV